MIVRKNNLTSSLCTVLLLAGITVSVWAAQYPAPTKPEVLYQDTDYIAEHSQSDTNTQTESADSDEAGYPATNAQPEVLYQDIEYIADHSQTESDSKYPAAYVKPEILYQDTDYIATH